MDFLENLYSGFLYPLERSTIKNSEYAKINNKLNKRCERFVKKLSKDESKEFNEIMEQEIQLSSISCADDYMTGFRHGARMMLDIMFGKSKNFKRHDESDQI